MRIKFIGKKQDISIFKIVKKFKKRTKQLKKFKKIKQLIEEILLFQI